MDSIEVDEVKIANYPNGAITANENLAVKANNTDNHSDIAQILESELGPKRGPMTVVLPITVLFLMILVSGVIGNLSTCVVIARNRYMRTATNYYLFSLAVSDLLLLVLGLPQELVQYWQEYPYMFGHVFCIVRGMASETSIYASIMSISAFTVERYLAICHPEQKHEASKLSRVVKIIVAIWIVAALCSVPIIIQFGIVHVPHPRTGLPIPESAQCTIRNFIPIVFEVSMALFFFAPMCVITILYLLIGYELRKMQLSRTSSDASSDSNEVAARLQVCARRAVLKMLREYAKLPVLEEN